MACAPVSINTSYIRESSDVWGLPSANTSSRGWGRAERGTEMRGGGGVTDRGSGFPWNPSSEGTHCLFLLIIEHGD